MVRASAWLTVGSRASHDSGCAVRPPRQRLRKLQLSLALGTRRSLLLPAAASDGQGPAASLRPRPCFACLPLPRPGRGEQERCCRQAGAGREGAEELQEGAGRGNRGRGCQGRQPHQSKVRFKDGLIDYFLKDPTGGGAT